MWAVAATFGVAADYRLLPEDDLSRRSRHLLLDQAMALANFPAAMLGKAVGVSRA